MLPKDRGAENLWLSSAHLYRLRALMAYLKSVISCQASWKVLWLQKNRCIISWSFTMICFWRMWSGCWWLWRPWTSLGLEVMGGRSGNISRSSSALPLPWSSWRHFLPNYSTPGFDTLDGIMDSLTLTQSVLNEAGIWEMEREKASQLYFKCQTFRSKTSEEYGKWEAVEYQL